MDNRLKRKSDFDLVFKKGKKCYGKSLMLVYLKSNRLKIGYSVSKKNGGAVVRNRIKRLLRAAMRELTPEINGTYYMVIVPRPSEEYEFRVFLGELRAVLKKEKLLSQQSVAPGD